MHYIHKIGGFYCKAKIFKTHTVQALIFIPEMFPSPDYWHRLVVVGITFDFFNVGFKEIPHPGPLVYPINLQFWQHIPAYPSETESIRKHLQEFVWRVSQNHQVHMGIRLLFAPRMGSDQQYSFDVIVFIPPLSHFT